MMAGVGTLLAALVALATFAVSQGWFDHKKQPVAVDSNGKPLPRLDEIVQWGPQQLLLDSSVDFDSDPPTRNDIDLDVDTYYWSDKEAVSSSYGMAKWIASDKPTQNGCYARLAAFGTSKDQAFEVGDKYCVMTSQARIVLIEVEQKTSDGWQITATVWKERTKID